MVRFSAKNLLREARRRRVFRTAGLYIVGAWVVVQIALAVFPALSISEAAIRYIWTAALLGFPLAVVFGWRYDIRGGRVERTASTRTDVSLSLGRGDFLLLGALGVVATAILASSLWEISTTEPEQGVSYVPTDVDINSVAVLPFVNMSSDPEQEYFSDGISEEILNGLAKFKTLKVAGRTSSFAFKDRNEDLREIGNALGVQNVLEGSVRKGGDRLRITAQLIKVSDGFLLWSGTYDRKLEDVFAVQSEISAAIIKELKGNLLGNEAPVLQTHEVGFAVYEKYLAARKKIATRSTANLVEARATLEEILAVEPDFPPALSSLAETLMLLRASLSTDGDLGPQEARILATRLLDHAIEIDPNFADAYAVQGLILQSNLKFDEANMVLLRAVELNPSLSNAWLWLGDSAHRLNRVEEAIGYYEKATAIDPLWLEPNSGLVNQYIGLGRIDEARTIIDRLRPFHQDSAIFHSADGRLKRINGQLADALRAYRLAHALDPDSPSISSQIVYLLTKLQEFEEAFEFAPPQLAILKNTISGEWDDVLPQLHKRLDQNPLDLQTLSFYLRGSRYVGDFEAIADYYDEYIKSPSTMFSMGLEDLALWLVPAMDALGRHEDRDELLAEYKAYLDDIESKGLYDNRIHHSGWASYLALTGDYEQSLERLQQAFDKGKRWESWVYEPYYLPMANDPKFLALKQQNLDAINSERAKLGWEPVAAVGIFIQ